MSNLLDGLTVAQKRLFAVRCARRVQHLMTADPRSLAALDVAERHTKGEATDAELAAAGDAATDAAHRSAKAERVEQQKILDEIKRPSNDKQ